MLFNSLEFLIFFPLVTILYFVAPHKFRWIILFSASAFFYMYHLPLFILLLFFVIIHNYIIALQIDNSRSPAKRKALMVTSVILNLGALAHFKYYSFLNDVISDALGLVNAENPIPYIHVILPLGISFYTFQALSYTIDVYRGTQSAEKHLGIFATFLMFYPQLVAGPIERAKNLLGQFYEKHEFNYHRVVDGLRLMLWGFFKKIVIADRLAIFVNQVYNNVDDYSGITLMLATIFFAFQVYCDFSGYSDIAIGAARVMGFNLMVNFNLPFTSKSITEFWRRWHISLSTWLNDYLFNPIAINYRNWGTWGTIFALIVTFFLSGLWHGAGWSFIIYGVLHGLAISYEFLTKKFRKKMSKNIAPSVYNPTSVLLTFLFVCFSFIFFRANNVADAFTIIQNMLVFKPAPFAEILSLTLRQRYDLFIAIPLLLLFIVLENINTNELMQKQFYTYRVFRYSSYVALISLIALFGVFKNQSEFIYFQF